MSTKQELKDYCKKKGIKGYSRLNKTGIEKLINAHKRKISKSQKKEIKKKLLTDEENDSIEILANKVKIGRFVEFTDILKSGMFGKKVGKIVAIGPERKGYLFPAYVIVEHDNNRIKTTMASYEKENGKESLIFTSSKSSSYNSGMMKMLKKRGGSMTSKRRPSNIRR